MLLDSAIANHDQASDQAHPHLIGPSATLLQLQEARAPTALPRVERCCGTPTPCGKFLRLGYPFIPEINPDPMRPISHSPNDSTQVPWSGAYPRGARPYPPEDPPRHCREACHKIHTITTLTSDAQWIWPVSLRPNAKGAATPRREARSPTMVVMKSSNGWRVWLARSPQCWQKSNMGWQDLVQAWQEVQKWLARSPTMDSKKSNNGWQ